jgi:N-acetylmuramoyl-L-alanine amidase
VNSKATLSLLASVLLASSIASLHSAQAPAFVQISGKPYVRLNDWAKSKGLTVRWLKREQTLELSHSSTKLLLKVDSREAQVNGVQVWLLFPLLSRNGVLHLTQLDTQTTLNPVLAHPKNQAGATIQSVCLDPGHGGKDPGNRVGSQYEKKYSLLLAQEVRQQLARAGLKVTLTRTTDSFVELPTRPELARRRQADLFVSLHFNAAASSRSSVRGVEVYCLTPAGASSTNARGEGGQVGALPGNRNNAKNMALAFQLQKSLTRNLVAEDRGVRRARFAVLRDATMPAVMVEGGFMSHPEEGKKIFDPEYRRKMARAITDGVLAYKRAVEQTS